jgi:hypothetical protein
MKKAVGLAFLLAVGAFAMPLDFNSLGTLDCGSAVGCAGGGSSLTFTNNGATLTLSYVANQEIGLNVAEAPDYTNTNFGTLNVVCTTCEGMTAAFMLAGASLNVGIEQINGVPFNAINPNMFLGALGGSLSVTNGAFGGAATVEFSPTEGAFSGVGHTVLYFLQQPEAFAVMSAGYALSINNPTTLQGGIQAAPEPVSLTLGGFGLLVIGLLKRRVRRSEKEA